MKELAVISVLCFIAHVIPGQTRITVKEAKQHLRDTVTILDKVYKAVLLKSGATMFKLGENEDLTVVIRAGMRYKFPKNPEKPSLGKMLK